MTEPQIWEAQAKPSVLEELGNGAYYYNYNITEKLVTVNDFETGGEKTETRWEYISAYFTTKPTHKDAIIAILRQYLSADDELAIINKYNAYKLGVGDISAVKEYEEYCKLIEEIRTKVKRDFNIQYA